MTARLRIGILGAARIADEGIIAPARALGHKIVAVAARDRVRAQAFAAEHGIPKVHETYAGVIADPDVEPGLQRACQLATHSVEHRRTQGRQACPQRETAHQ